MTRFGACSFWRDWGWRIRLRGDVRLNAALPFGYIGGATPGDHHGVDPTAVLAGAGRRPRPSHRDETAAAREPELLSFLGTGAADDHGGSLIRYLLQVSPTGAEHPVKTQEDCGTDVKKRAEYGGINIMAATERG
jgi:hypothetical protein